MASNFTFLIFTSFYHSMCERYREKKNYHVFVSYASFFFSSLGNCYSSGDQEIRKSGDQEIR